MAKSELWGKRVLVIREKESIITKGIANKLEQLECAVTVIAEDDPNRKEQIDHNDLILMYLSSDCLGSVTQSSLVEAICEQIEEDDKITIVVGEKDQEKSIIEAFPVLKEQTWIYRPVDMEELERVVRSALKTTEVSFDAKKILIVDDDPAFGKMVRGWLKDHYKIAVVTSGMAAISYLSKQEVDLILLDYEMPVTDGPTVLEMLRSEEMTAHIPVIFLTGVSNKEEVSRVIALKPEGYILKSTSFTDLLKYLQNFFKKHEK